MTHELKFCVDCINYRASPHSSPETNVDRCMSPALRAIDLVRGDFPPIFCDVERKPYGRCGPSAEHWQPNPDRFTATSQECSHVGEEEAEHGNPSF